MDRPTRQTDPGLDLPDDLVLALNLSRNDLEVLDSIAARRWTFADPREAELLRAAAAAISAKLPEAGHPMNDHELLTLALHSERARALLRSLDDRGVMIERMAYSETVAHLAKSLCGLEPMPIVPYGEAIARGWLLVSAAFRPWTTPDHAVWCVAQPAREGAEQEIRTYLIARLENPKSDLDETMRDIDDCRRALAWLNGSAPSPLAGEGRGEGLKQTTAEGGDA